MLGEERMPISTKPASVFDLLAPEDRNKLASLTGKFIPGTAPPTIQEQPKLTPQQIKEQEQQKEQQRKLQEQQQKKLQEEQQKRLASQQAAQQAVS